MFGRKREPKVTIENMDDNKREKGEEKKSGGGLFSRFKNSGSVGELTPTEQRAWELKERGYSGKQIAKELGISEASAFKHISLGRAKMGEKKNTPRTVTGNILTPKLQRIKDLKDKGWSNREIAAELGIEERTVVNNVTNINRAFKKAKQKEPFTAKNRKSRRNYGRDEDDYSSDYDDNLSSGSGRKYG